MEKRMIIRLPDCFLALCTNQRSRDLQHNFRCSQYLSRHRRSGHPRDFQKHFFICERIWDVASTFPGQNIVIQLTQKRLFLNFIFKFVSCTSFQPAPELVAILRTFSSLFHLFLYLFKAFFGHVFCNKIINTIQKVLKK